MSTETTTSPPPAETPLGTSTPNEAQIKAERIAKVRRDALAKGRDAKAEKKREAEAKGEVAPAPPRPTSEALDAGCEAFVRFCLMLAALAAWMAGGKIAELTDAELRKGAAEARPIIRRWSWLATVLTIVGYPLWLGRTIADKFERKAEKPPETTNTNNVRAIGGGHP